MRRREFIATTCAACFGVESLSALLSSCAAEDVVTGELADGKILVPLPLPGPGPVHVVRAKNYPDAIALVRRPGGEFQAFLLRCTHASNPLQVHGEGFTCSLHGSAFDIEGRVTHGPATRPLQALTTTVTANAVSVLVAG